MVYNILYFGRKIPAVCSRDFFSDGIYRWERMNELSGALTVAAQATDSTAAFMFNNTSAVGAGALEEDSLRVLYFAAVGRHVSLNCFGHRVGTGQNFVFTKTGR